MIRIVLFVVLLAGCSKSPSPSDVWAEKQLARREFLLRSCKGAADAKNYYVLEDFLKNPMCLDDPEFFDYRCAVDEWKERKNGLK